MKKNLFNLLLIIICFSFINNAVAISLKTTIYKASQAQTDQTNVNSAREQNVKGKLLKTAIPEGQDNFTTISNVVFSDNKNNDNYIFLGEGNNNQFGLYIQYNGKLAKIFNRNMQIPGGVGYFNEVKVVDFDKLKGQVVFVGKGAIQQEGVYYYNGRDLIKAVDQQDLIPGAFVRFDEFNGVSLDNNMIAFSAVGEDGSQGVYLYTASGLYKILTEHDKIDGKNTRSFEIDAGSLVYNQLTIKVNFTDGSKGIYLAKLSVSMY
jgi:hypothetical protein